jgi:hypothetical protein
MLRLTPLVVDRLVAHIGVVPVFPLALGRHSARSLAVEVAPVCPGYRCPGGSPHRDYWCSMGVGGFSRGERVACYHCWGGLLRRDCQAHSVSSSSSDGTPRHVSSLHNTDAGSQLRTVPLGKEMVEKF